MATTPDTGASPGGMFEWLKENPPLVIGGVIIGAVVLFGLVLKPKTPATSTPNADLSGLQNGNLVYVPTSTSFTTENINKGTNIGNTTTTSTTTSTTTTGDGRTCRPGYHFLAGHLGLAVPDGSYAVSGGYCIPNTTTVTPPPRKPPAPPPNPKPTSKSLVWTDRHTISGGETLSSIAASLTTKLRAAGMPGSQSITWHDLYAHNTSVINEQAAAHHNPIPGGPWNDVFPGEVITVPKWG
jgi:hypothetical protein